MVVNQSDFLYNSFMKHPQLQAEKRTILGRKVKQLRKTGIVPANIFGKNMESLSIQLTSADFVEKYKEVGATGLLDVQVDGTVYPVLIQNTHRNALSNEYLHVNFHKVNLKEKIKSMIPILIIGEAKAVAEKVGLLLQTLSEVEVEALPEDLPEHIEAHVETLAAVDDQIIVGQLKTPANVIVLTDPEQVVLKITELISKEAAEQAAEEEAASEEAKADGQTTHPETEPAKTETKEEVKS